MVTPNSNVDFLSLIPHNLSVESISKYYPENTSAWMYAMIALGSSFVVFVVWTIYLLCKPEKERRPYQSVNS